MKRIKVGYQKPIKFPVKIHMRGSINDRLKYLIDQIGKDRPQSIEIATYLRRLHHNKLILLLPKRIIRRNIKSGILYLPTLFFDYPEGLQKDLLRAGAVFHMEKSKL